MERFKLVLQYDGKDFCGFQIQPNKRTVQGEVEKALEFLLKEIGNGFVTWRYIFEDGNEAFGSEHPFEFSQVFLKTYLYELKQMATNIKYS